MKIFLIILAVIIGILIIAFIGQGILHQTTQVKTEDKGDVVQITDQLFGITLSYPKSWKKTQAPLGAGYIYLESTIDPQTAIMFWDMDSQKIENVDQLLQFAKKDSEKQANQEKLQSESIEKTTLNGRQVVLWKAKGTVNNKSVNYKQYYITDYNAGGDHYFVWAAQVATENKIESSDVSGANSILNSFNFIKKP